MKVEIEIDTNKLKLYLAIANDVFSDEYDNLSEKELIDMFFGKHTKKFGITDYKIKEN